METVRLRNRRLLVTNQTTETSVMQLPLYKLTKLRFFFLLNLQLGIQGTTQKRKTSSNDSTGKDGKKEGQHQTTAHNVFLSFLRAYPTLKEPLVDKVLEPSIWDTQVSKH